MTAGVLKYGIAGEVSSKAAKANFPNASVRGLSLCTTPIELLSNDGEDNVVNTATGFFWKRSGKAYLITNYHVISGRNPFTGKLGTNGYIPRKLRFYGHKIVSTGIGNHRPVGTVEFKEGVDLVIGEPLSVDGSPVDVWPIPISNEGLFGKDASRETHPEGSCFVNELDGDPIGTVAGDDCFILGYPLQNYIGLCLPVWKRGSIATDTQVGVDERPIFLIDAATTPGMSGAPIFRKMASGNTIHRESGAWIETNNFYFIGIYAGRLENAELQSTNLGYGWYRTLVDGAIDALEMKIKSKGPRLPVARGS